jgi:hypothetical protein
MASNAYELPLSDTWMDTGNYSLVRLIEYCAELLFCAVWFDTFILYWSNSFILFWSDSIFISSSGLIQYLFVSDFQHCALFHILRIFRSVRIQMV